ncbi:MAG: hypothetical protein H6860_01550 [Rhodospirillales bacterium]|nr:hypothetical protein [Alphaproteobacteria bacterium]MCB9981064.1 hypothetical protein [Rhodospirillales bacterium]
MSTNQKQDKLDKRAAALRNNLKKRKSPPKSAKTIERNPTVKDPKDGRP